MIYVVSGFRRSGTTAMMHALNAGGIPAVTSIEMDRRSAEYPSINGYVPTPIEHQYEIGRLVYLNGESMRNFVKAHPGTAIKVFFDGLPTLPVSEYTVIFMRRNSEEIKASVKQVEDFRALIKMGKNPTDAGYFDVYKDYNSADIKHCLDIAQARSDMDVKVVWFDQLIAEPQETLEKLELPFDAAEAAKAINPEFYRFRLEAA